MRAVIDRIVDGTDAVLLVEEREQRVVPREQLPAGAQEGDWLEVTFDGDRLVAAAVDDEATAAARARVHAKRRQLRARGRRTPDRASGCTGPDGR